MNAQGGFNICKICQRPKIEHVQFSITSDELKSKLTKRNQKGKKERTTSTICCEKFQRDLSGNSFDTCVCGFPKSAHVKKEITSGANFELTKKLTKRTKDESNAVVAASKNTSLSRNTKRRSSFLGSCVLAMSIIIAIIAGLVTTILLLPPEYQDTGIRMKDAFINDLLETTQFSKQSEVIQDSSHEGDVREDPQVVNGMQ
mmetsp:Transcript_11102/g.13868  ORF Transcript_11102/g.13868 Transcript_11102/m.13868 type:complete len:201 (+) Transcript_11102:167-769(+)